MNHDIPGGAAWSAAVKAGRTLTLTALADGANASVLIIGADRLDRLNIPDTLKSQMSARIRAGMVLMSDRGTALATVLASSLDWHDGLAGRGPDRLLQLELAKHGFGEADLHACINFFSKVGISDDSRASLTFVPDHATAGDTVTLRADQDLVVFVSTAAHPLASETSPAGVAVRIEAGEEVGDPPELREEAVRALEVTRGLLV
ncbi:hypothetical protein EV644_102503 [Kribbella orskensis]|uniref:DUF1989 domain-containing protein n=1 Tax=Kribbella orskensis TaxID=2512216 RepID=A0ABY2BS99_9ACTN|nr:MULTISPECIES: DUF1989 domain-containing protein [Kribbella]TCN42862.1 hypothetical protein EV642_102234 [Kribbella sp. VKM Ac-2500]TCO29782.1 hypothetical protein EV644_102503 [Kribbella orskensis]